MSTTIGPRVTVSSALLPAPPSYGFRTGYLDVAQIRIER